MKTLPNDKLNGKKKVSLESFKIIKCIGIGGFSRVYLVEKNDNKK